MALHWINVCNTSNNYFGNTVLCEIVTQFPLHQVQEFPWCQEVIYMRKNDAMLATITKVLDKISSSCTECITLSLPLSEHDIPSKNLLVVICKTTSSINSWSLMIVPFNFITVPVICLVSKVVRK